MSELAYIVAHVGILILLAVSVQIWFGAGLFIVATPLFFSVGIFVSSYLSVESGWSTWSAILMACALGSLSFLVLLPFLVRLHGIHLAMATIALAEMARIFGLNLTSLTGGAEGRIVPIVIGFRHVAIALAIVCAVSAFVQAGRRGHRLALIRHDRRVASLVGVKVRRTEVGMLLLGAAVTVLAGGLYAHMAGFVSPQEYGLTWAIDAIALAVIGGRYKWYGPLLGGLILDIIPEQLHLSNLLMDIVSGLLLVAVLVLFPAGLADKVGQLISRAWKAVRPQTDGPATTESGGATAPSVNIDPRDLTVNDVTVSYGGVTAVDAVSFSATPGSILGIIGPNGAGKTSLINAATGIARASGGYVTVGTSKVTGVTRAARNRVRRTFQHVQLVNTLTVRQNVELGRTGQSIEPAKIDATLGRLSLGDVAHRTPLELSLGKRRLTELARALVSDPSVLILDEPTSGCDEGSISLMKAAVRSYAGNGGTTVVISHDVSFVVDLADEVLLLANGRKVKTLRALDLVNDEDVRTTYLGGDYVAAAR